MSENLYLCQATRAGVRSAKGREKKLEACLCQRGLPYVSGFKRRNRSSPSGCSLDVKNETGTDINGKCVCLKKMVVGCLEVA